MPRAGKKLPDNKLVGLDVRLPDGRAYGKVIDVYDCGAGLVIDIQKTNGKTEMLPLNEKFLRQASDHMIVQPFEFTEAKE